MYEKIRLFFGQGLWNIEEGPFPLIKRKALQALRIIVLSFQEFRKDDAALKASTLTYFTLLSLVPVIAMLFGVAKGFGFERLLETQLTHQFPGNEQVIAQVVRYAQGLLDSTRGGLVAGIGVVLLLWSVIKGLGRVESFFNEIWGGIQARSLGHKISDYLSVMLIGPILFVMAGSLTVVISGQVEALFHRFAFLSMTGPMVLGLLGLLPYVMMWGLFTFLYLFIPNTRIPLSSALLGGIIAGSLYQLVQWGYITFQIGVSRYSVIYGSLAALPLFLGWLQLSWMIILFGAEMAFSHQHLSRYRYRLDKIRLTPHLERLVMLRIVHFVVMKFEAEEQPPSADSISENLRIPLSLALPVLKRLQTAGVVSQVEVTNHQRSGFLPARTPQSLTVSTVLKALDGYHADPFPFPADADWQRFGALLDEVWEQLEKLPANRLIKDL